MALDGVDDRGILLDVVHGNRHEVHAVASRRGQGLPRLDALLQDRLTLRVVGDPADVGPHQRKDRLLVGDVLGKAVEHTHHVLEPVPPRDLHDRSDIGVGGTVGTHDLALVGHPPRRSVATDERRLDVGVATRDARVHEDRRTDVVVQHFVLRREGIDRGRDDVNPRRIDRTGNEGPAGEDVRGRAVEMRAQEVPCLQHVAVRLVRTDVAPPDDGRSPLPHAFDEPRGLWVVEDDHVAATHSRRERGGVAGGDVLVVTTFSGAEPPAVTGRAVQEVVDALGDGEELGIAPKDGPPHVDTDVRGVGEEHL